MRITAATIRTLTLPRGKTDHIAWDDLVPGFGVRLRAGGSAGFVFQYAIGRKQRRMSLGMVTAVPIGAARKTAEELYARVKLGQDPAGQRAGVKIKAAETFAAISARFLAYQRTRLRPRSYPDVERHLLKHSRTLHGLQLNAITRRDIATVIAAVAENSGSTTGNRVRSSLSSLFSWAIREGLIEANPVIGTNVADERPRSRTLSPEELRLIWIHAGEDQYGSILRLLALTGARAGEIAGLRWSEVRGDTIVLPPERVKSDREHEIFLTGPALEILDRQPRRIGTDGNVRDLIFGHSATRGFTGWSVAKEKLDARIAEAVGKQMTDWRTHDLRRSFSTHANELGIALPHVIEACLGHTSNFRAGVAGTYNLASYRAEKRQAWQRWGETLLSWIEGRDSNVVTLRQG
jgi:integrase